MWIPSQHTAIRTRWCMSWGHRAPFGAVLGPFWGKFWGLGRFGAKCHRLWGKNGQRTSKRDPTRCLSGFCPKTRPPDPTGAHPGVLGSVWGRFGAVVGAKLANKRPAPCERETRTMGRDRTPNIVAWGPESHPGGGRFSIFGPVLGLVAACLLTKRRLIPLA